jgi:hypothetical protein
MRNMAASGVRRDACSGAVRLVSVLRQTGFELVEFGDAGSCGSNLEAGNDQISALCKGGALSSVGLAAATEGGRVGIGILADSGKAAASNGKATAAL